MGDMMEMADGMADEMAGRKGKQMGFQEQVDKVGMPIHVVLIMSPLAARAIRLHRFRRR